MMNAVIYFFGSGAAFFAGAALVVCAVGLAWSRRKTAATLLAVGGLAFLTLSAEPLPYWFYAVAGAASLLWLLAEQLNTGMLPRRRPWLRTAVALLWLGAAVAEVPHWFIPPIGKARHPELCIIGDSVTAGMGERSVQTWPGLLARSHPITVYDLSQAGGTAESALKKTAGASLGQGIVLLEIGGNDLLGPTPAGEFERNLDELLAAVAGPDRILVMFELPLLPFCNEFGRAQRRLAKKYQVRLIPKWVFVGVLTAGGATVDSIHLSPRGHKRMAAVVWDRVGPAYEGLSAE